MKLSDIPALTATIVALGLAAAHAGTYSTNFANGLDPAYFTVTQSTAGLYNVSTTPGDVHLAWAGTSNPGGLQTVNLNLNMAAIGGSLTGDFSTSMIFSNVVEPGPGLDQVQLNVLFNGTSNDFLDVYDNNEPGTYMPNVHVFENQNNSRYGVTATAATGGTFTVSRTGSTMTGYFNGTAIFSDTLASSVTAINMSLQNNLGSSDNSAVDLKGFSVTAPSVIPEPRSWVALLGGMSLLAAVCRRRLSA